MQACRKSRHAPAMHVAFAVALVFAVLPGCLSSSQEDIPIYSRLRSEALLTSVPYPNLVIEIDHAKGRAPNPLAINALMEMLENVTDKANLFLLDFEELPESDPRFNGDRAWTTNETYQAHADTFDSGTASTVRFGEGSNATLHILYLNGYAEDERRIDSPYGYQQYNVAYIFLDRIKDGTPSTNDQVPRLPNLAAERIERSVLIHEVGHALGLVNHGAPMIHERLSEDGTHSRYRESVMYSGLHGTYAFLDPVLGEDSTPYHFDQYDLQDLAAVREGVKGRS